MSFAELRLCPRFPRSAPSPWRSPIPASLTGGQDGTRYGSKLISKINYLANGLASGDFKPTSQQTEVQKVLEERLGNTVSQLDGLLGRELGAFNDMLRKKNIPNIIAKTP